MEMDMERYTQRQVERDKDTERWRETQTERDIEIERHTEKGSQKRYRNGERQRTHIYSTLIAILITIYKYNCSFPLFSINLLTVANLQTHTKYGYTENLS